MQALGGLQAAWELWERALIPSLMSGSGTWLGKCQMAVNLCDDIQNFFWRVMLRVPESCPKVALRCETKMMGMKWRLWQEKVLLLMRIKKHEKGTLCRDVYEEGKLKEWPGLGKEVTEICQVIGIPDVNNVVVSKHDVKRAISKHHYSDMINTVEGQTKLEDIKGDDFKGVPEYFYDRSVENQNSYGSQYTWQF